jgi:hypothetical protein
MQTVEAPVEMVEDLAAMRLAQKPTHFCNA